MLRIVVIALLLANALLIAVQLLARNERPPTLSVETEPEPDDAGLPTLVLLSELDETEQGALGSAECFTLGPFVNEEDRDRARRLIAASAIAITQRQTEATVTRGTWVYLPVQPDYVTARSMALTLRDAGFRDATVVREGEWNNSVSLGYFLSDRNAQSVFSDARSMGFQVVD